MMAQAASRLGCKLTVLDPGGLASPAGAVCGSAVCGSFTDAQSIRELAKQVLAAVKRALRGGTESAILVAGGAGASSCRRRRRCFSRGAGLEAAALGVLGWRRSGSRRSRASSA